MTGLSSLTYNGKLYTHDELMSIGYNVASGWGGECIGYSIDTGKKEVQFDCVEHGDFFFTIVGFDELRDYE